MRSGCRIHHNQQRCQQYPCKTAQYLSDHQFTLPPGFHSQTVWHCPSAVHYPIIQRSGKNASPFLSHFISCFPKRGAVFLLDFKGNPPHYSVLYIDVYKTDKKRGQAVITYKPFWNTLKQSDETTYTLIYNHNLSSSTIDRLRKNKPLSTTTINDLCRILSCDINDIITYQPSESDQVL